MVWKVFEFSTPFFVSLILYIYIYLHIDILLWIHVGGVDEPGSYKISALKISELIEFDLHVFVQIGEEKATEYTLED